MKKSEKRQKNDSLRARERGAWQHLRMSVCETVVVIRGEASATVHGCQRILTYSPESIRLQVRKRIVGVLGVGLCCTSFSGGTVTIEGEIRSVCYESAEGEESD